MLIAHLSDPHVTAPGRMAYGVAPVGDWLAEVVARINTLEPAVDAVVVTGDITYSGGLDEVREARRLLSSLSCPFFVIPGNHDDRETLWQGFAGAAIPARADGHLSFVIDDLPIRLIGLDSTRPGHPGGQIDLSRADWLRERLAEAPERRSLLLLHHPPVNLGVLETDEDGFDGHDLLADCLARPHAVERILCGHIHLPAHAVFGGVPVSVAPATGIELQLDLTRQKPSAFLLRPPGFLLHYADGNGPLVTHQVMLHADETPHPFEE